MNMMENTGMATATDGLRRHQWSMMSLLGRNLHQPPCCLPHLPVCFHQFLFLFLFLLSHLLFFLNHHRHLTWFNCPISLSLPPHLFNSLLAFTTKSLDPCTQCAQVLFVPTHDLHLPDATGICNASCLYALASCLDIFRS